VRAKVRGGELAGMEEVAFDENEIDLFSNGVSHDASEHTEEVLIAIGFIGSCSIGFAEVDVGGVEKFDHILKPASDSFSTIFWSLFTTVPLHLFSELNFMLEIYSLCASPKVQDQASLQAVPERWSTVDYQADNKPYR